MTAQGWEHVADTIARIKPERRMRVETCACGGRIRADRNEPTLYVRNHNRSKLHQEWRRQMGYDW